MVWVQSKISRHCIENARNRVIEISKDRVLPTNVVMRMRQKKYLMDTFVAAAVWRSTSFSIVACWSSIFLLVKFECLSVSKMWRRFRLSVKLWNTLCQHRKEHKRTLEWLCLHLERCTLSWHIQLSFPRSSPSSQYGQQESNSNSLTN